MTTTKIQLLPIFFGFASTSIAFISNLKELKMAKCWLSHLPFVFLIFLIPFFFLGCGGDTESTTGWNLSKSTETNIAPDIGDYTFNQTGCFSVKEDSNENVYISFSSESGNCVRFDNIEITNGAFYKEYGEIEGTNCPTDSYAISGSFITSSKAEGTIKYAYDCQITNTVTFVAELLPPAETTLADLFQGSFGLFQLLRNETGIYRDSAQFNGDHYHPASVATIGMGLISLCIANEMNWISNAEDLAIGTLQAITSNNTNFTPARNAKGYFKHWIDMETGQDSDWPSEYSSIDTAILVCGALFCKKYFNSPDIDYYADVLWDSIDWSVSIADKTTGGIYREFYQDGTGCADAIATPFNEYMIVAWLAMNAEQAAGDATELWNNHYQDPELLETKDYQGISLLTDGNYYLSHFVVQLNFYLCNYFTTSPEYLQYIENARRADQLYWSLHEDTDDNIWGLGAGSAETDNGYHADAIDNNPNMVCSPHIIAGFLPIHSDGRNDIQSLIDRNMGLYSLPNDEESTVLWRFSTENTSWKPTDIQGIDYALMLLGFAALPDNLGLDFFIENTNFFNNDIVAFE